MQLQLLPLAQRGELFGEPQPCSSRDRSGRLGSLRVFSSRAIVLLLLFYALDNTAS